MKKKILENWRLVDDEIQWIKMLSVDGNHLSSALRNREITFTNKRWAEWNGFDFDPIPVHQCLKNNPTPLDIN